MRLFPTPVLVVSLVAVGLLSSPRMVAHPAVAHDLVTAATAFLESLTPEQRARATFAVADAERENWHYVPRARRGVALKELTPAQRAAAMALLHAGLSERGRVQAETIIGLERILFEIEGDARRDTGLYSFTIFGQPDRAGAWGWRVEGHHLSINFTLAGSNRISTTPSFLGSNPAEIRRGPRTGERPLGDLEDLGRALMLSFDEGQRAKALIAEKAPSDILTTNQARVTPGKPEGLAVAAMRSEQAAALRTLVEAYVNRNRAELAAADLAKIAKAGWSSVHFAWAGGVKRGEGHYYRIQGPTFLIEYDNTQNGANHVHTVWRDPEGDFGRDALREHLARDHAPGAPPH